MMNNRFLFDSGEIYNFAGCMFRVAFYDTYKKTLESVQFVHGDEFLESTVKKIKENIGNEMLEDFNFFMNEETVFAAGILVLWVEKNIKTVEDLISIMEGMDSEYLITYLIVNDNNLTMQKIKELKADIRELYRYIEDNITFSEENKWRLLAMINDPDKYKGRFTNFIRNFYEQHYKPLSDIARNNVNTKSIDTLEYIEGDPENRIKELTLIDTEKDNSRRIIIGFSYFTEFGVSIVDSPVTNTSIVLMGTRHMEISRLNNMESLTDESLVEICKVIGDKTRIEMLKIMKSGPIYGTQVAEKFKMSNPAVSYHMDLLFAAGLVTAQKEGHRLYYYLKPARIEQVIKYLNNLIRM